MGFYIQDDMWQGASALPRKQRDEVIGALSQLYFEGTEAPLKGAALAVFLTCRERVLLAKTRSKASSRPKPRGKHGASKRESKPNQNEIKRASKPEPSIKEGEGEGEEETEVSSNPPSPPRGGSRDYPALGFVDPDDLPSDEPGEFERFAAECIDAFNGITGKDYRATGGRDWLDLRRIFDSGRTVDDVRQVVRSKRDQWRDSPEMSRYLRPSTLFGEHFEEYLNELRGDGSDESGDWNFG